MTITQEWIKSEVPQQKDPIKNIGKLTKEEKGDFAKELKRINDLTQDTNKLTSYVILILVVMILTLLVTVSGMVISAYQNQSASYQNLTNKVSEQKDQQVQDLQNQITQLKKNNSYLK